MHILIKGYFCISACKICVTLVQSHNFSDKFIIIIADTVLTSFTDAEKQVMNIFIKFLTEIYGKVINFSDQ